MTWEESFPESFDVGLPTGGHVHFDSNGITVYDNDGVTVIGTWGPPNGIQVLRGKFATGVAANARTEIGEDPANPYIRMFSGTGGDEVGVNSSPGGVDVFWAPDGTIGITIRSAEKNGFQSQIQLSTDGSQAGTTITLLAHSVAFDKDGGSIGQVSWGEKGAAVITVLAGQQSANVNITFVGTYSLAPLPFTQVQSALAAALGATVIAFNVTTTGCTFRLQLASAVAANTQFQVNYKIEGV